MKQIKSLSLLTLIFFVISCTLSPKGMKRKKTDYNKQNFKRKYIEYFLKFTEPNDNERFFKKFIRGSNLLQQKPDVYRLVISKLYLDKDLKSTDVDHITRKVMQDFNKNTTFKPNKSTDYDPSKKLDPTDSAIAISPKNEAVFIDLNKTINDMANKIYGVEIEQNYKEIRYAPAIIIATTNYLAKYPNILSGVDSQSTRSHIRNYIQSEIDTNTESFPIILMIDHNFK